MKNPSVKDPNIRRDLNAIEEQLRSKKVSAFFATLLVVKLAILYAQSTFEDDDIYLKRKVPYFKERANVHLMNELNNPSGLHHLQILQVEWMMEILSLSGSRLFFRIKKAKANSVNGFMPDFSNGEVRNLGKNGFMLIFPDGNGEIVEMILPPDFLKFFK